MSPFRTSSWLVVFALTAQPLAGQGASGSPGPYGQLGTRAEGTAVRRLDRASSTRLDAWQWVLLGFRGGQRGNAKVAYDLAVEPTWTQQRYLRTESGRDRNAFRINLAGQATVFPQGLVQATLVASHNRNSNTDSFGTERLRDQTEAGGELSLRSPLLPLQLRYRSQSFSEVVDGGSGNPFEWGQRSSLLQLSGRNRKMHVRVEHLGASPTAGPQFEAGSGERSRLLGQFDHRLQWGRGSRLLTSATYVRSGGADSYRTVGWQEQLHLQHTQRLSSGVLYSRTATRRGADHVSGQSAGWTTSLALASGLRGATQLLYQSTKYGGGRTGLLRLAPSVQIAPPLPWLVRFRASASAGYERFSSEFGSDGWIVVVDEAHVVDAGQRVVLDAPNIDDVSVSVKSTDGAIAYGRGVDFETVSSGLLLEIVILPAGRIGIGDTVLVSYRHHSDAPAGRGSALIARYDASLTVGPVRFYHTRWLRSIQDRPDVPVTGYSFQERDDVAAGAAVSVSSVFGHLDASAEYRRLEVDTYASSSYTGRVDLRFNMSGNAWGALGTSASRGSGPDSRHSSVASSGRVHWQPTRLLTLDANVGYWRLSTINDPVTHVVGGAADLRYRVGLMDIQLRYSRSVWHDGQRSIRDYLSISAARSF